MRRNGRHDVYLVWKHWPCVFPQVGPGTKPPRGIELEEWPWRVVESHPHRLVKGLFHPDGYRVTNRVRGRVGKRYEYPRYLFADRSTDIRRISDIRRIFVRACDLIGVECRPNRRYDHSIAHRHSVAIREWFTGPRR